MKPSTVIAWRRRKFRIDVAKSTVERYLAKRPKPASPTWRAFRANHVPSLVSIDFHDSIFGDIFRGRMKSMGILDGDEPEHREPQGAELGNVVAIPEAGGLHHRYVRAA